MLAQVATALVFFAGQGVDPSVAAATFGAVKERLGREGAPADLSAEHRALTAPKLFVDFAAPPPPFLPPALAPSWKSGSEACARQVGPTGPELEPRARAEAAAEARLCGEELGLAIWEVLLEQRPVTRVIELELRAAPRSGALSVVAALHEPGSRRRTLRLEKPGAERVAAAAARAVEDLLGGAGTVTPAPRHLLPQVGVPALEAGPFGAPEPAAIPASCPGPLPVRLEVFPPGQLARAIEAGYRTVPAARRQGKPKRCDLVVFPGSARTARARLSCHPDQLRAAISLDAPAGSLISKLVDRAVAALCARPAQPQARP